MTFSDWLQAHPWLSQLDFLFLVVSINTVGQAAAKARSKKKIDPDVH